MARGMTVLVPQGARRNAKPKVVLYNPPAAHYTMPLSLLAVGSALDRSRFEVRIIDARIDREPLRMLMREARDAVCVGGADS